MCRTSLTTRFPAAAYTAGLAAYYLRLAQLRMLNHRSGVRVPNTPQGIKDFIVNQASDDPAGTAWSRQPVEDEERPGIFNNVDLNMARCAWNPDENNQPLERLRRSSTNACCTGNEPASEVLPLPIDATVCHDEGSFQAMGISPSSQCRLTA